MDDVVRELAAELAHHPGASVVRKGVVATASPLTVTIGGSSVAEPAGRAAGYTPVVGHVVLVLIDGPGRIVLDQVLSG